MERKDIFIGPSQWKNEDEENRSIFVVGYDNATKEGLVSHNLDEENLTKLLVVIMEQNRLVKRAIIAAAKKISNEQQNEN